LLAVIQNSVISEAFKGAQQNVIGKFNKPVKINKFGLKIDTTQGKIISVVAHAISISTTIFTFLCSKKSIDHDKSIAGWSESKSSLMWAKIFNKLSIAAHLVATAFTIAFNDKARASKEYWVAEIFVYAIQGIEWRYLDTK